MDSRRRVRAGRAGRPPAGRPGELPRVDPDPAGAGDVLLAFPRGLEATARIVFFILLIGGAFAVIQATGAIDAGIGLAGAACRGREGLVVPFLMTVFALAGGTFGMAEETLPFLPALVLLARRLGYDDLTGAAIALVGAGAGFAGAFLDPFTVGVAHGIAGLPLFSGMGYRVIVWTVTTTLAVGFVVRHARRVRTAPAEVAASDAAIPSLVASRSGRPRLVLALLGLSIAVLVADVLRFEWGIFELGGLFLAVAIVAGLAGGLGASPWSRSRGPAGCASSGRSRRSGWPPGWFFCWSLTRCAGGRTDPQGGTDSELDTNNALRYAPIVIGSFGDRETERVFRRERSRRLGPEVQRVALRKLLLLDAAESLDDLRSPPGNRLEKLSGDRAGQHSIRVNDQWRICSVWRERSAFEVEIADYH